MANYAFTRTDAVKATKDGNIKSGRYVVGAVETAIENGNIVKTSGLLSTANREIFKAEAPGGVTTANCYLVATPELIYDQKTTSGQALNEFRNEAGENITLIGLEVGDMFSVSDEAITQIAGATAPVVGSYVTPSAVGTKWQEVASIAKSEVFYGKIIARELFKKDKYLNVIEMISVR